jgi:hypothetical protein
MPWCPIGGSTVSSTVSWAPSGPTRAGAASPWDVKNGFETDSEIEFIGPDIPYVVDRNFILRDHEGRQVDRVTHHAGGSISPSVKVEEGYLIRRRSVQAAD